MKGLLLTLFIYLLVLGAIVFLASHFGNMPKPAGRIPDLTNETQKHE